jgi:hypothetical protein
MSKLTIFDSCKTLTDLLRTLKIIAVQGPVPGRNFQIFVQAKTDYLELLEDPKFGFDKLPEWAQQDYIDFPEVLDQLIRLNGLDLEMIGSWLWVSGYTWKYKDQLKELGLNFAPDKRLWYWRPSDERSGNAHPIPIDLIREKYGTDAPEKPFVFDQPVPEETESTKTPRFRGNRHERAPIRTFQRS